MRSLPFYCQQRLSAAFCLLLLAALTLLGNAAAAQNAPTPVATLTGDKLLYSRHSARAGNSMQQPLQAGVQKQGLTMHERKAARRQYQAQHRADFPSLYRPGIE